MNLTIPFREGLDAQDENNLDLITARINSTWNVQHNPDGTHQDVTARSLAITTPPATPDTGNVTGDLVPAADNTYSLGKLWTTTLGTLLAWKNLFLSGTLYLGRHLVTTNYTPAWSVTSVSDDMSVTALLATTQHFKLIDFNGNTSLEAGGDNFVTVGSSISSGIKFARGTQHVVAAAFDAGLYERSRTTKVGDWITFTPTLTASAGTWTGGTVNTARYMLIGTTLFVAVNISGTSVSNAGVTLRIAIPGGFTAAFTEVNTITVKDNGTLVVGSMSVAATGTVMNIFTAAFGTFAISVGATDVYGVWAFEVQ